LADEADAQAWNAFVDEVKGRAFARFEWRDILRETYGATPLYLVARDEAGAVVGVLASYIVRDLRGRRRHYGVRNGLAARDAASAAILLDAAEAAGREAGAQSALLTSCGLPVPGLPADVRKTVALRLRGSEDETWDALRRETRVGVKRSMKRGAEIEWGLHNLSAFHAVFAENMLQKGVPFHSRRFFESLTRRLGERADLIVVRSGGEVAAGMIVLWSADVLDLYLGAWLRAHAPVVPYQRMYWEAIREAQRRGMRLVDMGESAEGGGTYNYKRNFGGEPEDVFYYSWPAKARSQGIGEAKPVRRSAFARADAALLGRSGRYAQWRQRRSRIV
jgi:CelD/BcsL family acetyltransferase involved in cellulose biosynthesis